MNEINKEALAATVKYLKSNYCNYLEWSNDNSAVCEKYGITNEEFLEIIRSELDDNRAASAVWKDILSTAVGLTDGAERKSIKELYNENAFSREDIRDAVGYASETFAKHAFRNSHRNAITHRFTLCKRLSKECETEEDSKQAEEMLKSIGVSENNIIYCFLRDAELTLEDASVKFEKEEDEILYDINTAIAIAENRQHSLYDRTVFKSLEENAEHSISLDVFQMIEALPSRESAVIKYLLGIDESITEKDFEGDGRIKPGHLHTFGETSAKFGISVNRVRQIVVKAFRWGRRCPSRRKLPKFED